ncbi:hypothetical protein CspHIS471_0505700 [Cutaneotrichosporon sp. HIS471]|nr:hypothetical protein CspHIS471_0505700 [Cutaneotrichosporon sp. HIS471]
MSDKHFNEKVSTVHYETAHNSHDADHAPDIKRVTSHGSRGRRPSHDKLPFTISDHEVKDEDIVEGEDMIRAHDEFTEKEYNRVIRKVDFIIMPMLMLLYGLQYSDKTSLSSGAVFGLLKDTHLDKAQFANLSTIFYVAYAVAQYPMMFMLQRFPLGRALAVCVIIWGSMVLCLAACNNYSQLLAVRFFLGWFEAVVTPGFAIFSAAWYLRKEQSLRQGLYYSMNSFFAVIFGVGIYYLADNAQKKGGIAAWRVINLFLGGLTVGMGFVFLVFGGTPDEVWWLSKREKRMAKARIVSNATGGGERQPWKWDQVRECLRDPQWYCALLFNLLPSIPNGAISTFMNLIFTGLGFTPLESVLFSLPMYGLCFVGMIISSLIVRYYVWMRFPLGIFWQCTVIVVLFFLGFADKAGKWTKYGVMVMGVSFSIGTFILAWPTISVNVAGRTKKSFFGGSSLIAYCIGNIIGSQVMRPDDAPLYRRGMTICGTVMVVNIVNSFVWWWHYKRENKKRHAEFLASGLTEEERDHQNFLAGEMDLTDMENRHFRYLA